MKSKALADRLLSFAAFSAPAGERSAALALVAKRLQSGGDVELQIWLQRAAIIREARKHENTNGNGSG